MAPSLPLWLPLWQSILLGIAALVVIAILIELLIKRKRPRPSLAEQFLGDEVNDEDYDKPELGMEAIDMDVIRASEQGNKSAASLGARDMQFWTRNTRRRHPRKVDTPQMRTTGEKK
ncbi:hypothetical protein [Profundibacter sp.]